MMPTQTPSNTGPMSASDAGTSVGEQAKATPTAREPRRDGGLAWLVLLGLLLFAIAPLIVEVQRPALWTQQEALFVAISEETHERKAPINEADTSLDTWTPVYLGATRWDLPPGGIWLVQVMSLGLPQEDVNTSVFGPSKLALRARVVSILMALLFVGAVYWSGYSIGGNLTGTLSALVAMTMPLLVFFGRHAGPHTAALAWSTLSIAGALWAMRPLRAAPSLPRQLIGWLVCGIALGFATLTAGPIAIPTTALCTIAMAMVCPRRFGYIMGLVTSTVMAALILMPWVLHVHDQNPEVWRDWLKQMAPGLGGTDVIQSTKGIGLQLSLAATLLGPWLIWLVAALFQPFSTSSSGARRKMLLGWVWLIVAGLMLVSLQDPTSYASMLTLLAPASVAIGLTVHQFHDRSAEARHARLWRIGRWLSCGLMLVLAIALPVLGYLLNQRPDLVRWMPYLTPDLIQVTHWTFYAGMSAALLLTAGLSIRFAIHHHPGQTVACLAVWLIIAYSLAAIPVTRSAAFTNEVEPAPAPRLSTPSHLPIHP